MNKKSTTKINFGHVIFILCFFLKGHWITLDIYCAFSNVYFCWFHTRKLIAQWENEGFMRTSWIGYQNHGISSGAQLQKPAASPPKRLSNMNHHQWMHSVDQSSELSKTVGNFTNRIPSRAICSVAEITVMPQSSGQDLSYLLNLYLAIE